MVWRFAVQNRHEINSRFSWKNKLRDKNFFRKKKVFILKKFFSKNLCIKVHFEPTDDCIALLFDSDTPFKAFSILPGFERGVFAPPNFERILTPDVMKAYFFYSNPMRDSPNGVDWRILKPRQGAGVQCVAAVEKSKILYYTRYVKKSGYPPKCVLLVIIPRAQAKG